MAGHTAPSETSTEPNLAGRLLGDYRIDHRLGWGGMAVVYLAQQKSLGRPVALKVLRTTLAHDDNYIRRFVNEAKAAAKLVHSNIVQIYEVGNTDGVRFIAQEYVPGQNLKQLLTQYPLGIPIDQAIQITWQVALALQKAAEQQITHRDIKPENILLTNEGEVKVADFGLARIAADKNSAALTQVGVTMGTPLYMSPEQVEGKAVGPASDLYSLGVTLYEMLTGRPPFVGDSALAIAVQHLKTSAPSLVSHPNLKTAPKICAIVDKLLEKEPENRYGHPRHLLADLRSLAMPGVSVGFSSDTFNWRPSAGSQPVPAKFEATQQLDLLLKTRAQAIQKARPFSTWKIAAIALLAIAAGCGLAWGTRPRPLLAWSESELPKIPRLETPAAQWFFAQIANANVEQAWQAIPKYHPPGESADNLTYSYWAKIGLAKWYLSQGKYDQALPLYAELAVLSDSGTTSRFRCMGQAGLAVIYDKQDNTSQVRETLSRVVFRKADLDDYLRSEIERLESKYIPPASNTRK